MVGRQKRQKGTVPILQFELELSPFLTLAELEEAEADLDVVVEVTLADHPGAGDWSQIQSPDHDPNGNIVFEGEADGELIWRKNRATGTFALINGTTRRLSPAGL